MKEHPQHEEVVQAIKAMPLWDNPQTFSESEIAECYSDAELVEAFGWDGDKACTPKQAVKAVKERCALRQSVREDIEATAF
jgi:hypothetical protein